MGGQCWLCGSATSDLYRQLVSRPAQVPGRDENSAGTGGAQPPAKALGAGAN
jgi:hypothetical protein